MERIKQALEKARQERQQAAGQLLTSVTSGKEAPSRLGQIVYSQTKTVEIPSDLLKERRVIDGSESNAFSDGYKLLRTQILQRMRENKWNTLAVTSASSNEGKTLTAINLGISLAMEHDQTVLLVDTDLRRPSVHRYFDIEPEYGLSDCLTSGIPLSEALIHPTAFPGFVILPGGKPLPNSSEMLNSPKMIRLVQELKLRYNSRMVLFDLPPLLAADDALAFSPYVEAALVVIEEGRTSARDITQAVSLLQGTNVLGTVLNKSQVNTGNMDTYYGYGSDKAQDGSKVAGWFRHLANKALSGRQRTRDWITRLRHKGK